MRANTLRWWLIAALVVAAAVNVVGNKMGSAAIGWIGSAFFFCAVGLYFVWRRAARAERRARVFDREAKTDETRTRPDQ